jgi:hypothetical protein
MDDLLFAFVQILDPGRARTVEHDPGHERVDLDLEVRSLQGRAQVGDRGAAPAPVADRHLRCAEPFLLGAVVVLCHRVPGGRAGGG